MPDSQEINSECKLLIFIMIMIMIIISSNCSSSSSNSSNGILYVIVRTLQRNRTNRRHMFIYIKRSVIRYFLTQLQRLRSPITFVCKLEIWESWWRSLKVQLPERQRCGFRSVWRPEIQEQGWKVTSQLNRETESEFNFLPPFCSD